MGQRKKGAFALILCVGIILISHSAFPRSPEEAEFRGAEILGEQIARWIARLEKRPGSISIFSVHSNAPLEQDFSTIVETEILKKMSEEGIEQVTSCAECRAPQISIESERLVISKGAPDLETLKKLGRKQPVESFLMVEIYRTKLSVLAQVVLYSNPTAVLIGAQRFAVPALNIADMAVQVLFNFGIGKVTSGKGSTDNGMATVVNLSLLEELGFGKGGLNLGTVISTGGGSLIYINPTLAFRGRFGSSYLGWSLLTGVGYGFTSEAKGISLRLAYDVFLGSWAVIGTELTFLFPDKSGVDTMKGFAGFHVGIALGR